MNYQNQNILAPTRVLNISSNDFFLSITDDYRTINVKWEDVTHIVAGKIKRKNPPYNLVFFIKDYKEAFLIDSSSFNFKSFLEQSIIKNELKFLKLTNLFVSQANKAFIDWPTGNMIQNKDAEYLPEFDNNHLLINYAIKIRQTEKFEEKKEITIVNAEKLTVIFERQLEALRKKRENVKIKLNKARDLYLSYSQNKNDNFILSQSYKEIEDAISVDPGYIDLYIFKADICRALNRPQNSLDALIEITKRISENKIDEAVSLNIYLYIADLYIELGNTKKACEMLQNYSGITPIKDINPEITEKIGNYLGTTDPNWYEPFEQGYQLFTEGNYFKAIDYFTQTIEAIPDFRWSYHWLAMCYLGMSNLLLTVDIMNKANSIYPTYTTLTELGMIYEKSEEFSEASNIYQQAIEFMPNCPDAYVYLSRLLLNHGGDEISAQDMLFKSLDLDPYNEFVDETYALIAQLEKTKESHKDLSEKRNKKIGDTFNDQYKIENIFEGGMGIVYIVNDLDNNDYTYAMKSFQDKFMWNDSVVKMFYHEAEIWVRLGENQNIVQAIKVEPFDGKPYIFLEYVKGTDLEAVLKKEKLDLEQILDFALQFCQGMSYAYKTLGVVHQDIKPSNCMITEDGILKITDFGLCKIYSEAKDENDKKSLSKFHKTNITSNNLENKEAIAGMSSNVIDFGIKNNKSTIENSTAGGNASRVGGTIPYMAPELFTGEGEANALTDIYSFGCMLYEMITNRTPFGDTDFEACIVGHISEIPQNPCSEREDLPDILGEIALKCLEKKPEDRFSDFSEVLMTFTKLCTALGFEPYNLGTKSSGDTLEKMKYRGESLMVLEKYTEASEIFTKALTLYPNNLEFLTERAECYRVIGKYNESYKDLSTVLKQNPNNSKAYYYLGLLYMSNKKFKEAHKYLYTASQLNPDNADIWLKLGSMYDLVGDFNTALKHYDTALKLNSKNAVAWNNKGNIMMKENKYFDALTCYTKAIEANPRYQIAWFNQGNVKQKMNLHMEAIQSFKKCLELNPKSLQSMISLAMSMSKMKLYKTAFTYFDEIMSLDDKNSYVYLLKAICYYESGNTEEGFGAIKKAVKLSPNSLQAIEYMFYMAITIHSYNEALNSFVKLPEEMQNHKTIAKFRDIINERGVLLKIFTEQTAIWFANTEIRNTTKNVFENFEELIQKYKTNYNIDNFIIKRRLYILNKISGKQDLTENDKKSGIQLIDEYNIAELDNETAIYSELFKKLKKSKGKIETIDSHKNLKDIYSKAIKLMEKEDYTKSLQEFQKIIQKAWGDINIWNSIIICKIKMKDYKGALNLIHQTIARAGIDIKYWLLKGYLEEKNNDKYEAFKTFMTVISIYPSSIEAVLKIISILQEIGADRKAGMFASTMLPFFDRISLENNKEIFTVSLLNLVAGRKDFAKKSLASFLEFNNSTKDSEILSIYIDIADENFDSSLEKISSFISKLENTEDFALNLSYLIKMYIYIKMKNEEKAIETFDKISTKFSYFTMAVYYKMIALVQLNNPDIDINAIISNYVSENQFNYSLWEARGYVLSKNKEIKYQEAIWAYSKALEIIPTAIIPNINSGLLMNKIGNYEEAINFFNRVLEIEPDNKYAILYKSISLMFSKKYEEAIEYSERLKCTNLRNEYIYIIKAIILKENNKINECLNEIEKAFAINPSNPEIWNLRGILMRKTNKLNDEMFSYNKALELDNDCISACINKGICFMEMKKYEDAKILFDKALSINPDNSNIWRESGKCQYYLEKYRDAIRCYDICIQQNQNDYDAYNGKAEALVALQKYSEALTAIKRSLEKNENQPKILNNLGVILYNLSRKEEAYNSFVKALNQNEIYQETIYNLLLITTEKNKTEEFETYKKKYVELFGSENLPTEATSKYMELPYTKNIVPYAYIDLSKHFDMQVKNLPYIFIQSEKYLDSFKNSYINAK